MKIGIDARYLKKQVGMGRFVANLLKNLAAIDQENQYILYIDDEAVKEKIQLSSNFTFKCLTPSNYFLWEQIILPRAIRNDHLDIFHCTTNTGPLAKNHGTKYITTIFDIMFMLPYSTLPQSSSWYQNIGRLYRKLVVPPLARRTDLITTISHFSKKDIHEILQINNQKIRTIYIGVEDYFFHTPSETSSKKILESFDVNHPYFFCLGGIDPRKNTQRIINAFSAFSQKEKYELLIATLTKEQSESLLEGIDSNTKSHIKFLGPITDEVLRVLYSQAKAFIYPSLYEGFGLPAVESLASGTPVIVSNTTSLPEIIGEAGEYVDPLDSQDIRDKIEQIISWSNEQKRRNQDLGIVQAQKFSWSEMAQFYLDIYQEIGGSK